MASVQTPKESTVQQRKKSDNLLKKGQSMRAISLQAFSQKVSSTPEQLRKNRFTSFEPVLEIA